MGQSIENMSKEQVLERLLEKELNYYRGILEITEQENQQLQDEDGLSSIASLTKKKGILFSCIQEIEEALEPLKRWWQKLEDKSGGEKERVQLCFRRIDALLKEILDLDKQNQKLVKDHLLNLRKKAGSFTS